jgi:uncharacterized membrane protein YuzA (DUF378 family)
VYQIIKYFDEGIIATVISKDRTLAHIIYYIPHVSAFMAIIRYIKPQNILGKE